MAASLAKDNSFVWDDVVLNQLTGEILTMELDGVSVKHLRTLPVVNLY
jgi:hypothetical protein